jgi:glycine/D-amino acid oxidase-like deaminating enzyme
MLKCKAPRTTPTLHFLAMPSPSSDSGDIVIIGAGVIGLALAHHLRKQGRGVTVVDRAEPASQCSMGNAGALSFHSVAPLAMPGVMKSALSMLRDPDGPLYLPPAYVPHAAQWLWRFVRAAGESRVREIAASLSAFFRSAEADQRQLASEVGYAANLRSNGQLHLYRSDEQLAKDALGWALKTEHGLKLRRIGGDEIRAMEPDVSADYPIGLFVENDHSVTNPHGYALAIAESVARAGVTFLRADVTAIRPRAQEGWEIATAGAPLVARDVVIAAGAWSTQLLAPLGVRVPLETQRGYHVHVPESGTRLSRTVVLTDRKVFITPMDTGLRIAGTVEFGGLAREANPRRAALLSRHAKEGLPALDLQNGSTTWMGHRPCMPDSMPVLGAASGHRGLWLAFGHGHLGLTGSATTGRLLAQAICTGRADEHDAFSMQRFSGLP